MENLEDKHICVESCFEDCEEAMFGLKGNSTSVRLKKYKGPIRLGKYRKMEANSIRKVLLRLKQEKKSLKKNHLTYMEVQKPPSDPWIVMAHSLKRSFLFTKEMISGSHIQRGTINVLSMIKIVTKNGKFMNKFRSK